MIGTVRGGPAAAIIETATAQPHVMRTSDPERMAVGWLDRVRDLIRGERRYANLAAPPEWHAAVRARGQYPVFADWVGVYSVDDTGVAYFAEFLDLRDQIVVTNPRDRHVVLWQAALKDESLARLRPVRGADHQTCDQCGGSGVQNLPGLTAEQASKLMCQCGGAGWLPRAGVPRASPGA